MEVVVTHFAHVPDWMAYPDHPDFLYVYYIATHDMVEGLYKAVDLFEAYTIKRFEVRPMSRENARR